MTDFQDTRLWATSLGSRDASDQYADERESLRRAYLDFRAQAAILAGEINRDLPDFTVHDVTHLDSLWETADQILGDDRTLTPAEAFVFGGSILVHDLGLGLAAYPEGPDLLETGDRWKDALTVALQRRLGRPISDQDRGEASDDARRDARTALLRELHALQAEQLALISWRHRGTSLYLLEKEELRRAYGRVIGRVAHSHWWSIDQVRQRLNQEISAAADLPSTWTVDVLLIACLLRTADACQIDARRAPRLLSAVRRPTLESEDHWVFQEKLHKPRIAGDRFEYHAGEGFTVDEATAWWLCLDLLRQADRELRAVDALLSDLSRTRFRVRGVSKVDSPDRFADDVEPVGWSPVDAVVKIGDVARLVRTLGGEELYGRNLRAPVRELIQNAIDATTARAALEGAAAAYAPTVDIRLVADDGGPWLEVRDNGVGMSRDVLTGTLLDFGNSLWSDQRVLSEFPGLTGRGFRSIGRFGIGFFSVFMLGARVQVITRRFETARSDAMVLEFRSGINERPLVRPATPSEQVADGGTLVRVLLDEDPDGDDGLLSWGTERLTLEQLALEIAPLPAAELRVQRDAAPEVVATPGDWTALSDEQLLSRLNVAPARRRKRNSQVADNLRELVEADGSVVGRLAVVPFDFAQGGVTVAGGLSVAHLTGLAGALYATISGAARDTAMPAVSRATLAAFASEQADLIPHLTDDLDELNQCAETIARLGGHTGSLPVMRTAAGWLNHVQAVEWIRSHDSVMFIDDYQLASLPDSARLLDDVAAADSGGISLLGGPRMPNWPEGFVHGGLYLPIGRAAAVALHTAWDIPFAEIADRPDEQPPARGFVEVAGETVTTPYYYAYGRPRS